MQGFWGNCFLTAGMLSRPCNRLSGAGAGVVPAGVQTPQILFGRRISQTVRVSRQSALAERPRFRCNPGIQVAGEGIWRRVVEILHPRFTEHSLAIPRSLACGSCGTPEVARPLPLEQERPADLISLVRSMMLGTTLTLPRWNWQKLFSYGEVVCFVTAWAVGLLIAVQAQRPSHEPMSNRSFASATDSLGIQANLRR